MNTQQLESFLQVADTLSFAQAAQALNITQSAVSRQVRALEEELDVKLFRRTTRTVLLTPEGVLFLEHARAILGQLRLAAAKLHRQSEGQPQVLTIGCRGEVGMERLTLTLERCRTAIPSFHPMLKSIPYRSSLTRLVQGELDVVFGVEEPAPLGKGLTFTPLGEVPLCCAAPEGHPLARQTAVGVQELLAYPFILCDGHALPSQVTQHWGPITGRLGPERLHLCDSPLGVLSLVGSGYGCAILPRMAAPIPGVVFVPLQGAAPLRCGLIHPDEELSPLLQTFLASSAFL